MYDVLHEVFAAMSGNKIRILLTGFSVGWGLFILIVLIGSGNGMIHGLRNTFHSDTTNIIHLTPDKTQMAYNGVPEGRKIIVRKDDIELLKNQMDDCILRVSCRTASEVLTVAYADHNMTSSLVGITNGSLGFHNEYLKSGRDILPQDEMQQRPVCLISDCSVPILFPNGEKPIGKWINVGGVAFMVVGTYANYEELLKNHTVYAPAETVQKMFCADKGYSEFSIIAKDVRTKEEFNAYRKKLTTQLASQLNYNPDDVAAIRQKSYFEQYIQFINIFNIINFFVWFTGIATLIAGIVGISNIMLISVRERTRELGIRKAMGASNASIIRLVLLESVIISLIFGYIGMMFGIGLTQGLATVLDKGNVNTIFINPTVNFSVVIIANCIMTVAGLIAGYYPARHAVKIKLVQALNS